MPNTISYQPASVKKGWIASLLFLNIAALYGTIKNGIFETHVCNGLKTHYNIDKSN